MINSKKIMQVAGVMPKLRLGYKSGKGVVSTGVHRVKILSDRIRKAQDPKTLQDIEIMEYTVEEHGEKKIYDTRLKNKDGELSYLVIRLAEIEEGEEVFIQMKKIGVKNYIEVTPVKNGSRVEMSEEESDEEEGDDLSGYPSSPY